jgi:hypothetical protein
LKRGAIPRFEALPLPSLYCESLDLGGSDFGGCDLRQAMFNNCILDRAVFAGANLDDAIIDSCWLNYTNFDNAKLDKCRVDPGIRVHSICANKEWLAVGGPGGQVQIFKNGKLAALLKSHGDIVTALSLFSSKLASGGYADRTVRVTDLLSGVEVFRSNHPELGNIVSVRFSLDGQTLFYAELFGTVFAYGVNDWKLLWSKKFDSRLDWVFLLGEHLLLAHYDSVRIVDAGTGESLRTFSIPEDYGKEYAASQRYLAFSYLPSPESAYKVILLDLATGQTTAEWNCPYGLQVSALEILDSKIFAATEPDRTTVIGAEYYRVYGNSTASGRARLKAEEMPRPSVFILALDNGVLRQEVAIAETVSAMSSVDGSVLATTVDGKVFVISGKDLTHSQVLLAGAFASNVSLSGAQGASSFLAQLRIAQA